MVYGNTAYIREGVNKPETLTDIYFQSKYFTSFNSVNFPGNKANYSAGCKKLYAHVIMT